MRWTGFTRLRGMHRQAPSFVKQIRSPSMTGRFLAVMVLPLAS